MSLKGESTLFNVSTAIYDRVKRNEITEAEAKALIQDVSNHVSYLLEQFNAGKITEQELNDSLFDLEQRFIGSTRAEPSGEDQQPRESAPATKKKGRFPVVSSILILCLAALAVYGLTKASNMERALSAVTEERDSLAEELKAEQENNSALQSEYDILKEDYDETEGYAFDHFLMQTAVGIYYPETNNDTFHSPSCRLYRFGERGHTVIIASIDLIESGIEPCVFCHSDDEIDIIYSLINA